MTLVTCPDCKESISSLASSCPHCGVPLANVRGGGLEPDARRANEARPVAGIVVGAALGGITLVGSLLTLYATTFSEPSSAAAQAPFPGFRDLVLANQSARLTCALALLCGIALTLLRHARGVAVVRIACVVMMGVVTITLLGAMGIVTTAEAWTTLTPGSRAEIIGELAGSATAGWIEYGLVLFLFRKATRHRPLPREREAAA